jgi:hypothetical protein
MKQNEPVTYGAPTILIIEITRVLGTKIPKPERFGKLGRGRPAIFKVLRDGWRPEQGCHGGAAGLNLL